MNSQSINNNNQAMNNNQTMNLNINIGNPSSSSGESYFDGGLFQLIGWGFLGLLVTVLTLGFGLPFAACMVYRWETRHTVINGHRLYFDGTAAQLFGKWLLWLFLTIITLGIYSFWVTIRLKQWKISHTWFEN